MVIYKLDGIMKKIYFILCTVFALLSCNSENEKIDESVDNNISLTVESLAFLNNGDAIEGVNSVTVESSSDWQLIGKDDWCHPSVKSGKNGDVVTFTADENPDTENRIAVFSFVCGNKTSKLSVIQKQNNVITLYKDNIEVAKEGGEVFLRVSSNTEFECIIPEECKNWISVNSISKSRGVDLTVISLNISENDGFAFRKADVVLKAEDGNEAIANINQDRVLKLSSENGTYKAENAGGELSVNISTNLAYEVVIPEDAKSWITYNGSDDEITENPDDIVSTKANFTLTQGEEALRVCVVKLKAIDGSLESSFIVGQTGSQPSEKFNVPDPNFKKALSDLGYIWVDENDGTCEVTNIGMDAWQLNVPNMNIESIEGIEYLKNVQRIDLKNNNIKRADLSKLNLSIGITSSYFEGLCGNPLEYVDFGNSNVKYVKLEKSASLNGLTGSNGESSKHLIIKGSNVLGLYISNNADLTDINVYNCSKISEYGFDLRNCAVGKTLNLYTNRITPYSKPANLKVIFEDKQDF